MIKFEKQLEYIKSQLAWIKSKVELDNQLGLYDINKLREKTYLCIYYTRIYMNMEPKKCKLNR